MNKEVVELSILFIILLGLVIYLNIKIKQLKKETSK